MYVLLCTSHLVFVTDDLFAEALDAPVDGFFVGLGYVLGAQALAIDVQGDLRRFGQRIMVLACFG